jgi:gluconolactonase
MGSLADARVKIAIPPDCTYYSGWGARMPQTEVIAEGLAFPEGPVVMADESVIVVETFAGRITRCWRGGKETLCDIGDGPNGAAIGPDGALYVCNNGGIGPEYFSRADRVGRIERVDLSTGRFERLYDSCAGRPLSAPNDLVFDRDGNLWFSDFGRLEATGKQFGGLYACRPDGSSITQIADRALSYNGVGISPDMSTVYVADTMQARIYAFACELGKQTPRLLATVPGMVSLDSMAITAAGNICVATIGECGAISTVTPQGAVSFTPTEDRVTTNLAFGGSDMRSAYMTYSARGQLVKKLWPESGLRLAYG